MLHRARPCLGAVESKLVPRGVGYSTTYRCRTDILATTVSFDGAKFVARTDWAFNNLLYIGDITRAAWGSNPLANNGSWTAADGRQWRAECDTPTTGRNGCRSWVKASYITSSLVDGQRTYAWTSGWLLNNMVRFLPREPELPGPLDRP